MWRTGYESALKKRPQRHPPPIPLHPRQPLFHLSERPALLGRQGLDRHLIELADVAVLHLGFLVEPPAIDHTMGELLAATPGFQLVISYNPGYQHVMKDLKPSTRQRFISLEFSFPAAEHEARIVAHESGIEGADALFVVTCSPDRPSFNHDAMALHQRLGLRTDAFALVIDDGRVMVLESNESSAPTRSWSSRA